MNTFSQRLTEAMALRNLRQIDIAKATGMTTGKISSYVSGKYTPNGKTMTILARVLSVNPDWLAGTSDLMDVPRETTVLLQPDASELLSKFKKLDNIDRGKLLGYLDSLLAAEKYKKETVPCDIIPAALMPL